MSQIRGKSVPLYFGPQADLKTAAVADSYHNSFMYSISPGGGQSFEADPILGGNLNNNRDASAPAPGLADSACSLVLPGCLNHLGYALNMMFGAPTFTAGIDSAPNKRVYTSGKDALPATTLAYSLAADKHRRVLGFVGGQMTFNLGRNAGFARINVAGAARKVEKLTDLSLGTASTAMGLLRYAAYRGIFRVDGIAEASLLSAAPVYNNNLETAEFLTDDAFIGDIYPGEGTFSSPITVRYKNETYANLAADAFSGEDGLFPVEIEFQGAGEAKLILKAPNCRVAPTTEPITGPGGIDVQYEIMAEQTVNDPMLTVELYNFVAENDYL
ncbi:hypothetical protein DES40_1719 [Litorimonas taeanensis]|uniref:Tail tube protein n=1 Tax=Litorimonas taeanensis TaxID=568099 RepID=A0A420WD78_9PROT|nr:phage tail tube protein [Litorimonas taeanensis]RKQ68943.1 hypothetical protein DES40_1719 [Litorimonas taeanensis]